jgi:hypothetical protein
MPAAHEKHLVRFPKSAVSRDEEFNRVVEVRVSRDRLTVFVGEGIAEDVAPRVVYELSYDLRVLNVLVADEWRQRYRSLQAGGSVPRVPVEVILEQLKSSVKVL